MYSQPPQQSRHASGSRSFWSLVHRRPGLLAAIVTVVVGAAAVTLAVTVPGPQGAVPGPAEVTDAPVGTDRDVTDASAAVTYTLPEGWSPMDSDGLLFGMTSGATRDATASSGSLLAIGVVEDSLLTSTEPTLFDVAGRLASDLGEFFIPVAGIRTQPVDEAISVDGRQAWRSGYVVVPDDPTEEGGQIEVTVMTTAG
jgi:hypothetical protein